MKETIAIERCPECSMCHRYNVDITQARTDRGDEAVGEDELGLVFRTRVFTCPTMGTTFQHRFEIPQKFGTRIVEVHVGGLAVSNHEIVTTPDNPLNDTSDPFFDEVRQQYTPWNRNDLQSADILPRVEATRIINDGDGDPSPFIDEQLTILEQYAERNLSQARKDRLRFWAFKLPALICTAGTTTAATLNINSAAIAMSLIATICVGIDAAWPGGMLHNVHRRAARETRRLQHEMLLEWRSAQLQYADSPIELRRSVVKTLSTLRKERQRIDNYVTDAEASLGQDSSR